MCVPSPALFRENRNCVHGSYTPVTLIRNQHESRRMFKIRSTFGREFQTLITYTRSGMTSKLKFFIYSWICDSGRSDCIRAAFERQSKDSDGIRIAFQLNSFNIEIDSDSNRDAFEELSGSFGTFW